MAFKMSNPFKQKLMSLEQAYPKLSVKERLKRTHSKTKKQLCEESGGTWDSETKTCNLKKDK